MKRYQTVLGLLLLLCILLNCAGCDFRTNYDVFSSGNRKITSVSSSLRDHIGIVLDNEELVVCDYKGHELCRRCFDKHIKDVDVFNGKALVRFEDESIEFYSVNSGAMDLIVQRDFATLASPIKNAEIVGWADESVGIVVLLENGDLYSSDKSSSPCDLTKIDDHVITEACCEEHFTYIKENGEVIRMMYGSVYEPAPEIDPDIAGEIREFKLARFDDYEGYLGIGQDEVYFFSGTAPLLQDTHKDLSGIDIDSVKSGKHLYCSIVYRENDQWFYEGMRRDYKHYLNHETRRKIKVQQGENVLPIPGGVIFYTEHEVWIKLI